MTLVVARKRPDSATIVCDTKLTPPNDGRWTLADQANKIVCLESGWSIAYAGHVDYANDAVKRLLSSNPSAFKDIRDPLLAIHKEARGNNCDIDFIILAKPPSLHIHKICDGKCVPCASAAWIGDANAFSIFQEIFHLPDGAGHPLLRPRNDAMAGLDLEESNLRQPGDDERPEQLKNKMMKAIRAVIEDNNTPSVGGFSICLFIDKHGRSFWPRISVNLNSQSASTPGRDLIYGWAETGDFNYSVMIGKNPEDNFVAFYFRLTQRALVFRCWDDELPYGKFFEVGPPDECHDALEKMFALPIWSLVMERGASGAYELRDRGAPPL